MDLKNFLQDKKWKKMKKEQWLILFLAGILLLIIAMPTGKRDSTATDEIRTQAEQDSLEGTAECQSEYTSDLEQRLAQILSGMEGVGKVKVMLTLRDQGEAVVEKDVTMREEGETAGDGKRDQTGVNRAGSVESSETTVYVQSEGNETPFINKELLPQIDGILIVAEGGDDSAVRKNISESVEALFGLSAHKIKIVKMKAKGDSN